MIRNERNCQIKARTNRQVIRASRVVKGKGAFKICLCIRASQEYLLTVSCMYDK